MTEKTLETFLKESKKELGKKKKWEDPELFSKSDVWLKKILEGEAKLDKKMK